MIVSYAIFFIFTFAFGCCCSVDDVIVAVVVYDVFFSAFSIIYYFVWFYKPKASLFLVLQSFSYFIPKFLIFLFRECKNSKINKYIKTHLNTITNWFKK